MLDPGHCVPALGGGDRGGAGDADPTGAQSMGRRGQRAAGRHEVVHDHPQHRVGRRRAQPDRVGGELADRRPAPLDSGQLGRVRASRPEPEDAGDVGRDPVPPQCADRNRGEPVDMLAAAAPGDRSRRGHRHQQHGALRTELASDELPHSRGESHSEDPGEVAPGPLLVGQQRIPHGTRVGSRDGQRRQAGRLGIGTVPARTAERRAAPGAERTPRLGATGAAARQKQVGQDIEHAPTVPGAPVLGKTAIPICG